jgi:hypothetical protein
LLQKTFGKAIRYNEAIESNEYASYCIIHQLFPTKISLEGQFPRPDVSIRTILMED